MPLVDHVSEITKRVKAISPQNFLVVGLTADGQLITDESIDSATRFSGPDVVEQTSVRGRTPYPQILNRLAFVAS